MSGRTREEVLERISKYTRERNRWGDSYAKSGEQFALNEYDAYQARITELTWVLEALPEPQARQVYLLNGPFKGQKARIVVPEDPDRLAIRGVIYKLITDPDTGKSLGAYAWVEED